MGIAKQMSWLACAATVALATTTADAAVKVKLEAFVTGVTSPLAMVQPPGDDRFFIIEQPGRIRIADANGKLQGTPFPDIRHLIPVLWADFDERGLLGIAFPADFASSGKFYIAHTALLDYQGNLGKLFWWDHTNVVAEYSVSKDDPNVADPFSRKFISSIDWPQFNHNGHWIDFGQDGKLYLSTGDGGYANDWGIGHNVTEGNGQDMMSNQGKILRLNVDGSAASDNPFVGNDDVLDEIWASGFRNPWRCSFDMKTGELFCADVQQNSYEEIDLVQRGGNYGWRRMEGTHCFDYTKPDKHPASCDQSGLTMPILEHNHCKTRKDCRGTSVTGGYVYRGSHAAWDGAYIYGDWSKAFGVMDGQLLIGTKGADGKWTRNDIEVTNMDGNVPYVLGFAQDAAGEVYVLTSITTGPSSALDTIYKIVPSM